jgi:hypothetical protein
MSTPSAARGRMLVLAALAALALALVPVASAAGAAKPGAAKSPGKSPAHGATVQILSPREGAQPASRVQVKVRVRGSGFRAYLDGNDVTSRFHGKRLRSATFRPGKALRPGKANLFVVAGKGEATDVDSARFILRKRDQKLLHLRVTRRGGFVAPRIDLRTNEPLLQAKLWLNGRRIDGGLTMDADQEGLNGRLESARLRFGRNHLKVMVLQEDGLFAGRKLSFWVSRTKPIASAGGDRRVGLGGRAKLNASASRPPLRFLKLIPASKESAAAHSSNAPRATASAAVDPPPASTAGLSKAEKDKLEYEWEILEAPQGSEAKVLEPTEEEAELIPDFPGEYVVAVTVTAVDGTQSIDDLTVKAPVAAGPMGLPIQTITETGGIQVGFPEQEYAGTYPRVSNWVQMLVLEDGTAAPTQEKSLLEMSGVPVSKPGVLGFNTGQGKQLYDAVKATKTSQLVILSGQGVSAPIGKSDQENLKKSIEYLGGTISTHGTTPDGVQDLVSGQWSLIGHVNLVSGGAYQNAFAKVKGIPGFVGGATGMGGSLNGYLQSGNNSLGFQYVSPEVVSIDTKWTPNLEAAPSPAQNTIKIGESKYVSAAINTGDIAGCPCAVGIQVLFLDPSTLNVISSGTYGVLTMQGATDFAGIHALDEALHAQIANHAAGASSVVVVQDFGSWLSANWPAGNSTDWIQDTLPRNEYTPWWKAKPFPNKASQLAKSWNQANQYGFGSVAGNLGMLVGPGFHDVVANYRRPVYEPQQKKIIPRVWGGLTAIASTNLFDSSSAFGAGQGTLPAPGAMPAQGQTALFANGRITGALTRNNQSQWELSGATSGAGVPRAHNGAGGNAADEFISAALPALVLSPEHPYTCTEQHPDPCPGTGPELTKAMAYITGSIPQLNQYTNARNAYLDKSKIWGVAYTQIVSKGFVNCKVEAGFKEKTCEELRKVLATEFEDLASVEKAFGGLTSLIEGTTGHVHPSLKKIMEEVNGEVLKAKKNLLKEETKFNSHEWIETALSIAAAVMQITSAAEPGTELAYSPGALSALANLLKLSDESAVFFQPKKTKTAEQIPDNTGLIKTKIANLQEQLEASLTNAKGLLRHYEDIVRTDPVKLHEAAENFQLKWAQTSETELAFEQGMMIGVEQSAYESIMPLAFNQWIFSPRGTSVNPNGPQELPDRGYNCTYENGEGETDEFDNPLTNEPASMSGMNSVAWNAAPVGPQVNYTIRALKEKDNDIDLVAAQHSIGYGNNYVRHKGESPSESLTNRLFEIPTPGAKVTEPVGLGMNKEEFFGMESWLLREIQCGFAR